MMIGSSIRYYRRLKQLTQNELAEAANLSSSYVAKVEAGTRKLGREGAEKIAKVLGIPIGSIITYEEPRNSFYETLTYHKAFDELLDCTTSELNIIGDTVSQLKKALRANGAVL